MIETAASAHPHISPADDRTTLQFAALTAATVTLSRSSSDSSTARIFCKLSAFGATSGNRHTGSSKPIKLIAAFTGIGFDSTQLISIKGKYFRWITHAAAKFPP